jgi:hypothetical protein
MFDTRGERVAAVYRELARHAALVAAAPQLPVTRRKQAGPSIVYSLRLDRDEVAALEAQARLSRIKPTVWAWNLIREDGDTTR